MEGVEFELAASFRADPIAALERALHDVDRALGDQRLLLAWDEVPDMIAATPTMRESRLLPRRSPFCAASASAPVPTRFVGS